MHSHFISAVSLLAILIVFILWTYCNPTNSKELWLDLLLSIRAFRSRDCIVIIYASITVIPIAVRPAPHYFTSRWSTRYTLIGCVDSRGAKGLRRLFIGRGSIINFFSCSKTLASFVLNFYIYYTKFQLPSQELFFTCLK